MRWFRIAKKEAKESRLWIGLVDTAANRMLDEHRAALVQEATELKPIFRVIIKKLEGIWGSGK